jgi:flagellar biosynthesis/type III secretory pathway M-ring protein FliF/YscJ
LWCSLSSNEKTICAVASQNRSEDQSQADAVGKEEPDIDERTSQAVGGGRVKDSRINVAMTNDQLLKIRRIAKARGQNVSQVVRMWIDKSKVRE